MVSWLHGRDWGLIVNGPGCRAGKLVWRVAALLCAVAQSERIVARRRCVDSGLVFIGPQLGAALSQERRWLLVHGQTGSAVQKPFGASGAITQGLLSRPRRYWS